MSFTGSQLDSSAPLNEVGIAPSSRSRIVAPSSKAALPSLPLSLSTLPSGSHGCSFGALALHRQRTGCLHPAAVRIPFLSVATGQNLKWSKHVPLQIQAPSCELSSVFLPSHPRHPLSISS